MLKIKGCNIVKVLFFIILIYSLFGCNKKENDINNKRIIAEPQNVSKESKLDSKKIESSNGKYLVQFSSLLAGKDRDSKYWGDIDVFRIKHTKPELLDVEPLKESSGAEAFLVEDRDMRWSPDGRFLVIWKVDNLGEAAEKQTIGFVDVCTGTWEGFEGPGGNGATSDNFTGWKKGEPHTMLLIGEPPNWKNYIEALPINQPDPKECE